MTRVPPTSAAQLFLTPGFTLGITGHRSLDPPMMKSYTHLLGVWMDKIRPAVVISGMALGIDTVAAELALERGIALHAMVPGPWQANQWKSEHQDRWADLCAKATTVTIVDPSPLPANGAAKAKVISTLLKRNTWIVKNSTMLLACWDGRTGGGTTHAIRAAQKDNCPVLRLRPGAQGRLALGPEQVHRLLADAELGPIKAGLPTGLVPVTLEQETVHA